MLFNENKINFIDDYKYQDCNHPTKDGEYVSLQIESWILEKTLKRENGFHFDNLAISYLLNWKRETKNNRYPKELYDALNFFHT